MDDRELAKTVETWKAEMRKRFFVPDELEVIMNYGENNDISEWIKHCEETDTVVVKDSNDNHFIWGVDGMQEKLVTIDEFFLTICNSPYQKSHNGMDMSQEESDTIAHFIQLVSVLQKSSWYKHNLTYQENMNGDGENRGDMPSLEQTVLALVYFRQLLDSNDNVLINATNTYKKYSSNEQKNDYINAKRRSVYTLLDREPHFNNVKNIVDTYKTLFNVFLYGSLIIHNPLKVKNTNLRDSFKKIYLNSKLKTASIFELNMFLRNLLSPISMIAVAIQNDFGMWINENKVPAPDIMWQWNMFQWLPIVKDNRTLTENVNMGEAYNIQINFTGDDK